jgi:hypothetical protein
MAATRAEKEQAVALYIQGLSREAIGVRLGRPSSTILRWYEKGEPLGPNGERTDWEQSRKDVEEKARREVWARLEEDRVRLATTHFKDFEILRASWRKQFLEQYVDPATGEKIILGHDDDGTPRYKMVPRSDLTPRDMQFLASAYRNIQEGQVKVFGDSAYASGGEKSEATGLPKDIPVQFIEKLEEAIANASEDEVEEADADTEGE